MPTAQKGVDVDGPTWTWEYFLVPQYGDTPASSAFGLFSPVHLGVIVLLTVGLVLLVVRYRAADDVARRRIRMTVATSVLLLEVLRQLAYVAVGAYTPEILPLHICGVSAFIVMVDATVTNRWTGDFLYVLGWWGALAAVLFPEWAHRPILNIYTWQSFAVHALIFGYALMLLVGGDLVPKVANLVRVAAVITALATVAALANWVWGTNFWFLNVGSPGSPLEPIQAITGGAYIPVLIVLFALLTAVLYWPWHVNATRARAALTVLPPQPEPEPEPLAPVGG